MKTAALAFCAITLGAAAAQTDLRWQGRLDSLAEWTVGKNGGADGTVDASRHAEKAAVRMSSQSALAPNVWLSLSAGGTFPVTPGEELALQFEIAAEQSGRAFAAVVFAPAGGESRLYLPSGTYGWRKLDHAFQVPPGAAQARVIFGLDSASQALWIASAKVTASATARTDLDASWLPRPHPRVFPQSGPPAREVVSLDISSLDADQVLLATTLQGLINRKEPRIYLCQGNFDRLWAGRLVEDGAIASLREMPGLAELVEHFRAEIDGVILTDPALPASRHAAMMLGSLAGWPATNAATAAALHLPVREDLAGRWKRNVDMYREIWSKHRGEFASHVLAVHHPSMIQQGPRDYLFQQKIFTFWVSGQSDEEPGADPAAELDFAHEVLAATPPNIPVMGWWSFGDDKGLPEYDALRLCSSYAKFLAGSEYCTNLSLLSGMPVEAGVFQQRPTPQAPDESRELAVSFSVIDSGDSQWYWQHYQPKFWQDPARGRTPINWSLNPTVIDVMPALLAWYYRQATPNDLFYCAISGLGYMNPRVYGTRYKPADQDRIWTEYTAELSQYMSRLDLGILGVYAGSWGEGRHGMERVYQRFFSGAPAINAILSDFGRHDDTTPDNAIAVIDGKPVFHTLMRWLTWTRQDQLSGQLDKEEQSVAYTVKELLKHAPSARPAYMSGLILSWTMSPSLVERVARELPPDIRPVNADVLIKRWSSGQRPARSSE